jgi:hypothetical protein
MIIYKIDIPDAQDIKIGRKVGEWLPDSYMKAERLTASSSTGPIKIGSENIEEFKEYSFEFQQPDLRPPNVKIRLPDLCAAFCSFIRHKYDKADLMIYHQGFRVMGGEGNYKQKYGWGTFEEVRVIGSKTRFVLRNKDSEYTSFEVLLPFMRAITKLQTVAGNGGVAVIHGNKNALQLIIPISTIGKLKITIVPPDDEDDNKDQDLEREGQKPVLAAEEPDEEEEEEAEDLEEDE